MATFWDQRFDREDYVYGTAPNRFLAGHADRLRPGMRALVPGDGEGRNGVWLAGQGLEVLAVDSSAVGLAKARRLAQSRGVRVATEVVDLLDWAWPEAAFDAVVAIFLHVPSAARPRLHAAMLGALKPGGMVILEGFRREQLDYASGGPRDPDLLFTAAGLAADFAAAEILDLAEALDDLDEGEWHRGPAATVRLAARKPLPTRLAARKP